MKKITVEGYEVTVEKEDGVFIVSVPKLPGCTVQVEKEENIIPSIRGIIGDYLSELTKKKPRMKDVGTTQSKKDDDDPKSRIRK